jgi:hypothetical protein
MKRHVIAALAAPIAILPSIAFAESRTFEVDTFHGVDIATGIHATVAGGAAPSVVVDAKDAGSLDGLRVEVRDGILHVWRDWNIGDLFNWGGAPEINVTIGTQMLDTLEASSGALIDASVVMGEEIGLEASSGATIRTDKIEGMFYMIEASSGARIETSGFCTDANLEASSGASIAAKDLDCKTAKVEVSSGAGIELTVHDKLSADASSGGSATIHGHPSIGTLDSDSGGSVNFPD